MNKTEELLEFFGTVGKLKTTKRTGWLDRKLQNPESVADHSFRLAIMALVFSTKLGLDSGKAVKMALVHDLPEAVTGDISRDAVDEYSNSLGIKPRFSREQKKQAEENALEKILERLDKKNSEEISALWGEFEAQKTKTARLVKELDRLELMQQALEYKKNYPRNIALNDFLAYHKKFCRTTIPELKQAMKKITQAFEAGD